LRFDQAGDGDGRADLAMFFVTESNTNQPGIFTLTLTGWHAMAGRYSRVWL
jgi:hypothetical protein